MRPRSNKTERERDKAVQVDTDALKAEGISRKPNSSFRSKSKTKIRPQ